MESQLAKELKLHYEPVAILLSDEKPAGALQSKAGCWNCIIPMFIAAAKGKTAIFERKTTGCNGGKTGLGFGQFPNYPNGIEYFLSTGKDGEFEGEGYMKNPELAKNFVECLPITDIPYQYVIFKPLSQVDTVKEKPVLITFCVNIDQLSALVVMANYYRTGNENVMVPQSSGCQSIFIIPYAESKKENPKAVIGLTDITARPMLDPNILSFSVSYKMFIDMEENIPGSFFEKKQWQRIKNRL